LNWLKRQTPDLDEVRKNLEAIANEGHRADEIIKSVRAMFRNESTVRTLVNVNDLVQEVLASTDRAINSNGIVLETNLAGNPKPFVMADPVQLKQVVFNLTMNAIESMAASGDGAGTLLIETSIDGSNTVWLRLKILDLDSIRRQANNCSSRSSPRNPTAWVLGCRFVNRSSRNMEAS